MKGGTRKRGSTWSYYFDMGTVDGKRQKKEKGGFKTKKEAETALSKALNEYNNAGMVFEPASITLADYLDHWMENYCVVNLKSNTIKSYGRVIGKHIKPKLGKYRLKSITAAVIQKWLNQLKSDGYSKSSIILYRDVLSCALAYAVHPLQYIQFNPCVQVRLPKFEKVKEETRFIISPEDFQRIYARFDGTPYYVPLMIGYYTGMRVNEVFALTWDDIDLKARTISVTRTMIREKLLVKGESPWFFNSAKSEASNRTIKFGDTLHKVLKDAHHSKNLNRMKDGPNFIEYYYEESINKNGDPVFHLISHERADNCKFPIADMVCVRENGKYLPSDTMQNTVNRIINRELGIKFNFHSLRHTHATMLIENGASMKAVQERLGHANVTVTMSIYNHLTEKQEDEAVNIFEQISKIL